MDEHGQYPTLRELADGAEDVIEVPAVIVRELFAERDALWAERDRLRAVVETLLRRIDAARPGTDVFPLRGSQEAHDVRAALDVCGKAQPNPHCCGHPTWVHEGTGDRACLWQSDLPGGGYAKASLRRGSSCPCEALDGSADMGGELRHESR